jgi:hypothetical protein
MTTETENGEICSIHQCPLHTCPADCPNKNVVSPDSEPNREKHFTKDEILREIKQIAQDSGIESNDFQSEPEKEECDSEGNLLFLSIQVTQEYAHKKGEGSIGYTYMAKGKYNAGESLATVIMKTYGSIEEPDEVYFSNVVSELKDNEWVRS